MMMMMAMMTMALSLTSNQFINFHLVWITFFVMIMKMTILSWQWQWSDINLQRALWSDFKLPDQTGWAIMMMMWMVVMGCWWGYWLSCVFKSCFQYWSSVYSHSCFDSVPPVWWFQLASLLNTVYHLPHVAKYLLPQYIYECVFYANESLEIPLSHFKEYSAFTSTGHWLSFGFAAPAF